MIGGDLVRVIGHEGALRWSNRFDHIEKLRSRIAFNVQFFAVLIAQCFQFVRIRVARMTLVRTRMQGNTVRTEV